MSKIDFKKLKRDRNKSTELLKKKMESEGGFKKDERIWKATYDKTGKAYHVLRFLPDQENRQFVKEISYSVKGKNGWYFEKSPKMKSHELPDPAQEYKALMWQKGESAGSKSEEEEFKRLAKSVKRNEKWYANVLVIEDSENKENEGKVMIYQFGRAVYNLIKKGLEPEHKDDEEVDAFNLWEEGANTILRLSGKEVDQGGKPVLMPDYKDIKFGKKEPLGTDEEIEEYWKQTYDLAEFEKTDDIKEYDELKKKFNRVMGLSGEEGVEGTAGDNMDTSIPEEAAPEPESDEPDSPYEEEGDDNDDGVEEEPQPMEEPADDDDIMKHFS